MLASYILWGIFLSILLWRALIHPLRIDGPYTNRGQRHRKLMLGMVLLAFADLGLAGVPIMQSGFGHVIVTAIDILVVLVLIWLTGSDDNRPRRRRRRRVTKEQLGKLMRELSPIPPLPVRPKRAPAV